MIATNLIIIARKEAKEFLKASSNAGIHYKKKKTKKTKEVKILGKLQRDVLEL